MALSFMIFLSYEQTTQYHIYKNEKMIDHELFLLNEETKEYLVLIIASVALAINPIPTPTTATNAA